MNRTSDLKRLVPLMIFGGLLIGSSSIAAPTIFDQDVEILESDISGVTFRYLAPDPSINRFIDGQTGFYSLQIPRTAQKGSDGEVDIPVKIVPLAIPPGAKPLIKVLDSGYQPVPFKKIAPYFSRSTSEAFQEAYLSPAAENPKLPPQQPYLEKVSQVRGLNVVRVAIPTALYSMQPENLSLLKSMTVRVEFEPVQGGALMGYRNPGPVFDRIFNRTVANYDAGKEWYEPRGGSTFSPTTAASVFDSASTWIRIELSSDGIYGFGWTHFNIAGVNPADVDPANIRVFYGGGRELPVPNSQPRPQLKEIPIEIIGGGDGTFDNGDFVVFYADAVDSWQYSSQFGRYLSYRNHYTDKNVYWLTIDGNFSSPPRRLAITNGSPIGIPDMSVETYTAVFHREQEMVFRSNTGGIVDYFDWYWGLNRDFATSIQVYDLVPGATTKVVVRHQAGNPTLVVNGSPPLDPQTYQTYSTYYSTNFNNGANTLQLQSQTDFYLDYIDVEYSRWLKVIDGSLLFAQPDTFGVIRYNLTEVSGPLVLLDISDVGSPVKITGGNFSGSTFVFQDTVSAASHKRYYVSSQARLKSPGSVSLYQIDDLLDPDLPQNNAQEIVVAYDAFYDQAIRFANFRTQSYGLETRVVKLSDIYNQFSYGLPDPTAIRDFLRYTYLNWPEPAPSFALLLGDGNYDYRNNLGNNIRNYVPPFENTQWMTDEHFIYFGNEGYLDSDSDYFPDMVIGRVSARSAQEAEDFVDKTIDYDSNPELGPWRDRIISVADDNLHPIPPRFDVSETFHTDQAEVLANNHVPPKFEITKLYLVEYLMGTGGEKPEAREAFISAFNQGALLVNWIGHGSANLWADERVFRRIQDIPRLANGKRLPLVFTASCSIGKFDFPSPECMAEDFLRGRTNGTIAVISATRDVFAAPNAQLNNYLFDQLLYEDSAGMGESLYMAKFLRAGGRPDSQVLFNDRSYMVFGDPAQLLQYPKYRVRVVSAPDSLVALSVDSLSGEIVDAQGTVQSSFNGTVWVTVKDGSVRREVMLRDRFNNPLGSFLAFKGSGSSIFIGPADVTNGTFTSRFFIPKDISYGSQGARIYAYASNGSIDALGVEDSIRVSGSLPSIQDTIGPSVSLFTDGRPFANGVTMVASGFTLGAELFDAHGINITGQLGHSIVIGVDDGEVYEADVTGYFRYDQGAYQSGRLDYRLPELPLGEHEFSLKAWDNFNNSTLIRARIEIVATGDLELTDVMNYPNPVKAGDNATAFQYCLNSDVDKVSIRIFTESGRKIKTIDLTSQDMTHMDCNQYDWNLLDADGDNIANGIYLYKISAERQGGDGRKESTDKTGKLVILR